MSIVKGNRSHNLKKAVIGAHPIIQYYIEKLNLSAIIRTYIPSDKRLVIQAADSINVLIHNILTQPMALYKVPEWLETLDMETLGFTCITASHFNDDRIARLLDAVYKSKRKQIFFRIALRAIKLFELNCSVIHQDTTSIPLYGRYDKWKHDPLAANGYSKDHRPDLKQLVLGITVAGDGAIPLLHEVYSGNRTDDTVHISNWNRLRHLLQTTDFMYTSDGKLCTDTNLSHIEFYGGQYITVMPRTWKEDTLFREKVSDNDVHWRLILERPNNRHPDSVVDKYYTTKAEMTLTKHRRIIWIKSTQKADIDRQARENRIQRTIDELHMINSKINRYNLKRRKDIKEAVIDVLNKFDTQRLIHSSISQRTMVKKIYKTKGRPRKDTPASFHRWKEYRITFEIKDDEVKCQSKTDGVFPLLTNNQDKSARDILTTYKYQAFLEKRHEQLKSWLKIFPVYLKKPKRVLALLDITIIALAVATLMERDLRRGMEKHHVVSLPVYPEKRECKYPTTQSIIRTFSNIEKYDVYDDRGNTIEYFPPTLSKLQKQILNLMEVPIELFA